MTLADELIALDRQEGTFEYINGRLYDVSKSIAVPTSRLESVAATQVNEISEDLMLALKRDPRAVHELHPRKFEMLVAELLSGRGAKVELTSYAKDGGRDVLAYLDSPLGPMLCLVEAKRYKPANKVSVKLVRELLGSLSLHNASTGMLVTTSSFTGPAQKVAGELKYRVSLQDYGALARWIAEHKKK